MLLIYVCFHIILILIMFFETIICDFKDFCKEFTIEPFTLLFICIFFCILAPITGFFFIESTNLVNIRKQNWSLFLKYALLFSPILALSLLWFV